MTETQRDNLIKWAEAFEEGDDKKVREIYTASLEENWGESTFGLNNEQMSYLLELNDNGTKFVEIAKQIRQYAESI